MRLWRDAYKHRFKNVLFFCAIMRRGETVFSILETTVPRAVLRISALINTVSASLHTARA